MRRIGGFKSLTNIIFKQQASAPASPSSGSNVFYVKSDGFFYKKDSSGNETFVESPSPQSMSDAVATQYGHKTYSHGTTYNGGIAPTITLNTGGGALSNVKIGDFVPRQMQDGTWRCEFNIEVTLTTTSRSGATLSINGLTFFNTGGDGQGITGWNDGSSNTLYALAAPNSSILSLAYATASTNVHLFSGLVRLASKPTWAF